MPWTQTSRPSTSTFAEVLRAHKLHSWIGTRRVLRKFDQPPTAIIQRDGSGSSIDGERGREEEVLRFYKLAKKAEWQVRDLPWSDAPPIPELRGSPQRQARRRDVWRSVIQQQLQADELAVEMATQLFSIAPHHEAKLYYTTMVQDESRHTEAWLQLIVRGRRRGRARPVPRQDGAAS